MSKIKKTVQGAFHIELDEYKEAFPETKGVINQHIVIGFPGLVPKSVITLKNKKQESLERNKLRELGAVVLKVGKDIKDPLIEEGDLVLANFEDNDVKNFKEKKFNIKGCFPSLRKYAVATVPYYTVHSILDMDKLETETTDLEFSDDQYKNFVKKVEDE